MTAEVDTARSESIITLRFELSDASMPVRTVAERDGYRFILEEIIPRGNGRYVTYYSVDSCDSDRIPDLTTGHETSDADFFNHSETTGLLEVTVMDDFPPIVLAAQGAIPQQLVVADGMMTLTVDVPPKYDANRIIARFDEVYPDGKLTVRRQQPHATPVFNASSFEQALTERLTDRQHEVLLTAFEGGFYEWPREKRGEQLAEQLEIASPTFYQHLRLAEKKLLQLVFWEHGLQDDED